MKCENFKMHKQYRGEGLFYKFHEKVIFNQFVIIGATTKKIPEFKEFGKILQIRVGAGIAGTDVFLLRHCDGSISSHANQFIYKVTPEGEAKFKEMFKEIDDYSEDSTNVEYSIMGKEKATGFMVYGMPKSEEVLSFSMAIIKGKP